MTGFMPAFALLCWTAAEDLYRRRIDNVVLAVSFVIGLVITQDIAVSVLSALVVFVYTGILYNAGWIAGGDVKLATVLAVLIGMWAVPVFWAALVVCKYAANRFRQAQPFAPYLLGAYLILEGIHLYANG